MPEYRISTNGTALTVQIEGVEGRLVPTQGAELDRDEIAGCLDATIERGSHGPAAARPEG